MNPLPGVWRSTGFTQHTEPVDRVPDYDPQSGDHLWTITSMYRWGGPEVEVPHLDLESLLLIVGPACFYCEQAWTPLLATRRCKGEPK